MKTIGKEILKFQEKNELNNIASELSNYLVHRNLISRYGSSEQFLETFNPTNQVALCRDKYDCIMGDYATLSELRACYGERLPVSFVMACLYSLSEYSGCREKLPVEQAEECASIIANEWHYLKVSELALFFYRIKQGCYGKFYGSVDPMSITYFLNDFVRDRNNMICSFEAEARKRKREAEAEHCITHEQYLKMIDEALR